MTTIAWDGERLAADTQANCGYTGSTHKLHRIEHPTMGACLVGGAGDADLVREHMAWLRAGARPEDFPESLRNEDGRSQLLVIAPDRVVRLYQRTPYPIEMLDQHMAIGSGGEIARAAMYCGRTAPEAVEVAIALDESTGGQVEVLTL